MKANAWWIAGGGLIAGLFFLSLALEILDPGGRLRDGDGTRPLVEMLPDRPGSTLDRAREGAAASDPVVRGASIAVLLDAGDPLAPSLLRLALTDADPRLRRIVLAASPRAGADDFPGDLVAACLFEADSQIHLPAAAALAAAPREAPVLAYLVSSVYGADARGARDSLLLAQRRHDGEPDDAREIVRAGLSHPEPSVRAQALGIASSWNPVEAQLFLTEIQALAADADPNLAGPASALAARLGGG